MSTTDNATNYHRPRRALELVIIIGFATSSLHVAAQGDVDSGDPGAGDASVVSDGGVAPVIDAAASDEGALAGGSNARRADDSPTLEPMAHDYSPWLALVIGAVGSLAYLLAAYSGFIGQDEQARARILAHFDGGPPSVFAKVVAFGAAGGGVAMVFQFTEHYLVPVQAFILGCTWPAVVANHLSGSQRGSDTRVEVQVASEMRRSEDLRQQEQALSALPQTAPVEPDRARAILTDLLSKLPTDGAEAPVATGTQPQADEAAPVAPPPTKPQTPEKS